MALSVRSGRDLRQPGISSTRLDFVPWRVDNERAISGSIGPEIATTPNACSATDRPHRLYRLCGRFRFVVVAMHLALTLGRVYFICDCLRVTVLPSSEWGVTRCRFYPFGAVS